MAKGRLRPCAIICAACRLGQRQAVLEPGVLKPPVIIIRIINGMIVPTGILSAKTDIE